MTKKKKVGPSHEGGLALEDDNEGQAEAPPASCKQELPPRKPLPLSLR